MSPLGRLGCFVFGLSARRHLLDVFEAKQQLVLGQRLGPSAEAMALQLWMICSSRSARARSASNIAFSVPGSSGSVSAMTAMARLNHRPRLVASTPTVLIHCAAGSARLHRCRRLDCMYPAPVEALQ